MNIHGLAAPVTFSCNVKPAGLPDITIAGIPEMITPGQNGYLIPKEVASTGHSFLSGIPEVVIAKDAYIISGQY